jgi:hypothetical protein
MSPIGSPARVGSSPPARALLHCPPGPFSPMRVGSGVWHRVGDFCCGGSSVFLHPPQFLAPMRHGFDWGPPHSRPPCHASIDTRVNVVDHPQRLSGRSPRRSIEDVRRVHARPPRRNCGGISAISIVAASKGEGGPIFRSRGRGRALRSRHVAAQGTRRQRAWICQDRRRGRLRGSEGAYAGLYFDAAARIL